MISINAKYQPVAALILQGGKYTRFAVPQFHRQGDKDVADGFINILAKGDYDFHRGDTIRILRITGANVISAKYFSIFAEIEHIPAMIAKAEQNSKLLEHDIPDDI